jgi:hypothetical protein
MRRIAVVLLFAFSFAGRIFAQAGNASLTGFIQDSAKAFVPDVYVLAVNTDTNQQFSARTNKEGSYNISALPVGPYRMQIEKVGFQTILKEDLFLHTQDALQVNFQMAVGSISETVTVSGTSVNMNTTDATVGTIIDRQFISDIPLNGRSFQSLVLLSPGVTTTTPQPTDAEGEYSVNGQTANSNNYLLDGADASATNYMKSNPIFGGAGTAGMAPNATALGSTQALVNVDALQEFRIATSTYSAEFGRQPGAQISFQSRSGTNDYHGTAFDYLRNTVMDANNWFNNYATPKITKPQERQNDFGGVFGGPLGVPHLLSGKDRAFFFVSYEGLRLTQPGAVAVGYVPSNGTFNTGTYSNPQLTNLRANAPAALQAVLAGFPVPNCSTAQDPQCIDYRDGLSPALVTPVSIGRIDSMSARADLQVSSANRIFARYSDTESNTTTDPESGATYLGNAAGVTYRTRVYLLGANSILSSSLTNEIRLQYSQSLYDDINSPTSFGGAKPANLWTLGSMPPGGETAFFLHFPSADNVNMYTISFGTRQFQPNAVDTLTWQHGSHLFKAGVNYVQTTAYMADGNLSKGPQITYVYETGAQVLSNTLYEISLQQILRQDPSFKNFGTFFQDEWHYRPRLSLSLGLRWDLSPAPAVSGAEPYTYSGNLSNPSSVTLAPLGTPLYATTYTNFAPRVGIAAVIHDQPGHELILRVGGGLFYGTGQAFVNTYGNGYDVGTGYTRLFTASNKPPASPAYPNGIPLSFPIPPTLATPPIPAPGPPYALGYLPTRDYSPPYTIQWSATLEQAIGKAQSISLGYVASASPQLGHWSQYSFGALNTKFSSFYAWSNGPGSNYNSLQLQYKRQALRGLQVLAGFTWSHAIDSNSTDYYLGLPLQRGNSDMDVRNNATAALVYNLPKDYVERWKRAVLGGWNVDARLTARTAFPVQIQGPTVLDPITGLEVARRLNYNGQNPYVYKNGIPGGRQLNAAVFSVTTTAEGSNGNSPRNFLRGFGDVQADIALQRKFSFTESLGLLFRAEAFNITNHPNFGALNVACGTTTAGAACSGPLFGQAINTLSGALGGLASIYQQGGPRSLQVALKLQF